MPIAVGYRIVDPEKHRAEWSTRYELGGLTGPVMVTPIALHLLETGELHLGDKIGGILPELKGSDAGNATIEMTLRHTSGLPIWKPLPEDVRTREQVKDVLRGLKADLEPGTICRRSDVNFILLGLVIEARLGKPVQKLALEQLAWPLGMANTVTDLPANLRAETAPGPYSEWHGRFAWGEAADPGAYILGPSAGNGGTITNADDLAVFARAMIAMYEGQTDDYVTSSTLQLSTRPDARVSNGQDQGLGWQLGGLGPGSFGWDDAAGCSLWINPRIKTFVIFLSNRNHPKVIEDESFAVRDQVFDRIQRSILALGPQASLLPVRDLRKHRMQPQKFSSGACRLALPGPG